MRYLGSKSRISKHIVPIIQGYVDLSQGYYEPFMGGMNVADKIVCKKRICSDSHKQLVALFKKVQENIDDIPDVVSNEFYDDVSAHKEDYEDWVLGLVGFTAGYGGKYFGGYARNFHGDTTCNISRGAIQNLKKQRPSILDIDVRCTDFLKIEPSKFTNFTFYCDPPYKDTTKYKTSTFPYEEFYDWCRAVKANGNYVLVSESKMPTDFTCIWELEVPNLISSQKAPGEKRTERLFALNNI